MAIDGPGIIDSDTAHDAYNEVIDVYDAQQVDRGNELMPLRDALLWSDFDERGS